MTENNIDLIIESQQEFVAWLKANGMYNQIESAHTMQQMHRVWENSRPPLRSMSEAPRDETYILVYGTRFDGGAAVVAWLDDCWWYLDDGKNFEIAMRGNEEDLRGWIPLPVAVK